MRRLLLSALLIGLTACPGDDEPVDTVGGTPEVPQDTIDLSQITAEIPPPAPDTGSPPPRRREREQPAPSVPNAPEALMAAVQREQAVSTFCFREFGLKQDPTLRGGVAVVVTVGRSGITDARVENSNWSSGAGAAVNRCLNDKAKVAWKLGAGEVSPGRYVVPLRFSGI